MTDVPKILYCHCAYAQVIPEEVKLAVLKGLIDSKVDFDSVPDLCEMSARREPLLKNLANVPNLRIAACYARAVKGLFTSAGCSLPEEGATVINMRVQKPDEALAALLDGIGSTTSARSLETSEESSVRSSDGIEELAVSETSETHQG